MRDKTLAGILALLLGGAGIHRFYLGQIGLGFLYLFFFWITWIVGIIDAIALFSMDQDDFDRKYNKFMFERRNEYAPRQQQRRRYANERQRPRPESRRERQRRPNYQRNRSEEASRDSRRQRDHRRPRPKPANPHRSEGIRLFKEYDYQGAIEAFKQALEIDPRDIATHWNLACAYSLEEEKDKAFYHLDKAVTFGFDDKDRIRNHDALAYLRIQPEYEQFVENGFRLVPQLDAPKEDLLAQFEEKQEEAPPQADNSPPLSTDLLDQLQRLGDLREKGLLTEEEFAAQKRKLLG
jgi:TM2 domain-containing membrane protein YozV